MMTSNDDDRPETEALNALERKLWDRDREPLIVAARDLFEGVESDEKVAIRDLSSTEVMEATRHSLARRKAVLSSLPPGYIEHFTSDPRFLSDVLAVEEIWRAFRRAADPSQPILSSAERYHDLFTTTQLTALYGWLEMARTRPTNMPNGVDQEATDRVVRTVAAEPEGALAVLMRMPRWMICEMFILLAVRFVAKEAYAEALRTGVAAEGEVAT